MGKTHKGAVWLDPERFSPYEYYQFWVNSDDADVARFLALFTFLPMEEIEVVKALEGADLNKAKAVLAFEATQIAHGKDEAVKALEATATVFGGLEIPNDLLPSADIPRKTISSEKDASVPSSAYEKDSILGTVPLVDLLTETGLCTSKSDARRLIKQGGAYINGERISGFDQVITDGDVDSQQVLLRAGKKKYHKIIIN